MTHTARGYNYSSSSCHISSDMISKTAPECEPHESPIARNSHFGPYLTGLPLDLLQNLYRYCGIKDRLALARVSRTPTVSHRRVHGGAQFTA